jgi:hypothetical protein
VKIILNFKDKVNVCIIRYHRNYQRINHTNRCVLKVRAIVKLSLWVSNMPWRHMGQWRFSSTSLDLGNRWSWVVSFMSRPLYPREWSRRYPLDRRLHGFRSPYGSSGEEKMLHSRESDPGHPASSPSLTDWAIPTPAQSKGPELNATERERIKYFLMIMNYIKFILIFKS